MKPDRRPMGRFRALNRCGVYRDHPTGEEFEERISKRTAFAIQRGDIEFIEEVVPVLQPGSYSLPPGWLTANSPTNAAPEGAVSIRR